jgi:hypothetical protein
MHCFVDYFRSLSVRRISTFDNPMYLRWRNAEADKRCKIPNNRFWNSGVRFSTPVLAIAKTKKLLLPLGREVNSRYQNVQKRSCILLNSESGVWV